MKRHPSKRVLLDYAENLVDNQAAISAKLAAHITSCPQCQAEVSAIQSSFELIRKASELEPSKEFMAEIMLAAQQTRHRLEQRRAKHSMALSLAKGMACAAGVVVMSVICFSIALNERTPGESIPSAAPQVASETSFSPEAMRNAMTQIQTLASAVSTPSKQPASAWEIEHRRMVHALSADIEAARAALERNPGCLRASQMVSTNLQRQVETLRALYVERSL